MLVKNQRAALKLHKLIRDESNSFKCTPRSIIPLNVICQGLLA